MSAATVTLVAQREIRERSRSVSLRLSTAISLIVVAVAVALPALHKGREPSYGVGVVGAISAPLAQAIRQAGTTIGATVHLVPYPNEAAADQAVLAKHITAALIDRQRLIVDQQISSGDTATRAVFVAELSRAIAVQAGLEDVGLPAARAAALANPAPLPVTALKAAQTSSKTSTERVTVFYGILLLLMLVNQYGYWLLLGVVEEKSTRVVEVLLSAITPDELLAGKTVGIGVLALGQGLAIVAVALVVGAATGSDLLKGAAPAGVLVALLWFVLGYIFYCSLYAAGGSLASRTEDAQNIGLPLQIPLLIAYFSSFSALLSGSVNPVTRVMAFLPPTAPIAMPVLVATGHAGPVAVAVSVAITLGGAVLLMRLAAKIYRRAILRTGRRVKVREVLRGRVA